MSTEEAKTDCQGLFGITSDEETEFLALGKIPLNVITEEQWQRYNDILHKILSGRKPDNN